MKANNFITYFTKSINQQVKLADVDLLAKIDFHLHNRLSLSFPQAQFPVDKEKPKERPTACTLQAATFSSILQHGKRCVGSDTTEIAVAISLSIQRFHSKHFLRNE